MNKQEQVQQMTTYMANFVSHIAKVLPDDIIAKLDELGAQEDAAVQGHFVDHEAEPEAGQGAEPSQLPGYWCAPVLGKVRRGLPPHRRGGGSAEGGCGQVHPAEAPLRHNSVETFGSSSTPAATSAKAPLPSGGTSSRTATSARSTAYMAGGGCTLPGKAMVLMPGAGYEGVTKFVMDVMTSYRRQSAAPRCWWAWALPPLLRPPLCCPRRL